MSTQKKVALQLILSKTNVSFRPEAASNAPQMLMMFGCAQRSKDFRTSVAIDF